MSRGYSELVALFGRSSVESAIANQDAARTWESQHQVDVIKAIQRLQSVIQDPSSAVEYVASLDPQLRNSLIVTLL